MQQGHLLNIKKEYLKIIAICSLFSFQNKKNGSFSYLDGKLCLFFLYFLTIKTLKMIFYGNMTFKIFVKRENVSEIKYGRFSCCSSQMTSIS